MKRELGSLERALIISDQYAPFHSVCVLKLESPPPPQILKQALRSVQIHHPFLQARLLKEKGRYFLATLADAILPFHVLPRWNDEHWVQVAEVELETRIEISDKPIFRCTYLYSANHSRAEILLTFFHPIVDSASLGQLIQELLTTCASFMDERTVAVYELPPSPPVESRLPYGYRGVWLGWHILRIAVQQAGDEILYRLQTRGKRTPPLRGQSHGHILSLQFPESFVETLVRRAQLEKVTLNALLTAAMLTAINRNLYAGQYVPMRTLSFVDMRPFVEPPLTNENLACYISMLRHTVPVKGGIDFWLLVRRLQRKMNASFRSGDHFVSTVMVESLLKILTRSQSFRLGATALNFDGVSPLKTEYGGIRLVGVHQYASAYTLGPEFAGQARLFNGQLIWDFVYLDTDMSADEAKAIVEETRSILNSALTSPLFRI